MAQFVTLTKTFEDGNTATGSEIFDPLKMGDIKLNTAGTFVQFSYPNPTAADPRKRKTVQTNVATLATLLASINAASPSGSQVYIGRVNTTSGFGIGAHNLLDLNGNAIVLPDNTRVWAGYYEVITTFTSATDAATISIDIATDDVAGLKAATAISTGTTYDKVGADGTPVLLIPQQSVATVSEKTTAARSVTYTVAIEAVTAGDMYIFLECITIGA